MTENAVKVMQVGQLVMLVKDNTPVGIEVVWEGSVTQAPDACAVLNILRSAHNDAAWIVRQVERVNTSNKNIDSDEGSTVQ